MPLAPRCPGLLLHLPCASIPPPVQVPLDKPLPSEDQLVPVTVWDWSGVAADEGQAAAAWLTSFLGLPARLLRYVGERPLQTS